MTPNDRAQSGPTDDAERTVPRRILGGRYELHEELGHGGMAVVWAGIDLRLGRRVAVKTLRPEHAADSTFQARFRREAQSAASLNHHSIVAVYDNGEGDLNGISVPYIVMEYVEGRTLRDILREGRPILPERALEVVAEILDALEYSHRAGIIHRDVKPANVMVTPAGDVKVMDFGIARAISDVSAGLTQTSAVIGTAQYLSPEQARSEQVDARSDVYSTGCLLYELLTGRPPFTGDSPVSVAYQHVREEPRPPSAVSPGVPPEADRITMQALRKDPADRYQSAAQMRADIERALAGENVLASEAPTVAAATAVAPMPADATAQFAPAADPEPRWGETAEQRRWAPDDRDGPDDRDEEKRRALPWVLALVGLVLLGILAFAAYRLIDGGSAQTTSAPSLIGKTESQAKAALAAKNLKLGDTSEKPSEDAPKGQIIAQDPAPGGSVRVGGAIDVTLSSGKPEVRIPEVVGDQAADARTKLEEAGFRVRDKEDKQSSKPGGEVTRVDPPEGSLVAKNSLVTIYHSTGLTEVPDVSKKDEGEAKAILEDAGFKVRVIREENADADPGTVVSQIPDAGSRREAGTRVTIVVAKEPKATSEPTPTDTPTPTDSPSPSPSPTDDKHDNNDHGFPDLPGLP
ncbi:Stk1 family PASTA domain-containing Ser/Thr kinase [Actinopolymorpha singaporensis]|uniref:non-specific serine/threonine protein kinase n=1 Tax=Actinopolymorpha singaporensis TaxID=117157 RepID=A0A1H1PH71_9ACTN|nr:Stk1 family PASTA domain-containing Ser/Thr kinase [Actinopolymorpha singaporensis]SDS10484.1 serine/threonine protein kinase [Actinopolymorpha singaporensis]